MGFSAHSTLKKANENIQQRTLPGFLTVIPSINNAGNKKY